MKYLGIIILSLTLAQGFSQTKQSELTDAEQFSLQTGTLIERKFFNAGTVKGIELQILKYKDLNTNTSKSALRLQTKGKNAYATDSHIASLDKDEIEDLIKAIKTLQTKVFPTNPETYTEVTFRSRGGFEAGAYFTKDKTKWVGYVQLVNRTRDSMVFLSPEEFSSLLVLVEQSKITME